ncbi:MAG: hypothetical protein Q9225_007960, partial [Loekoesia sp. 1 TL-2023]
MGIIYNCAMRVIVWLGDKDATSDVAMAFARDLCLNLTLYNNLPRRELLTFSNLGKLIEGTDFILPDEHSPLWAALANLLNRKWLQRLWVIQEAVLNPNTVVFYGNSRVAWSVFTQLAIQLDAQAALLPFLSTDGQMSAGLHLAGSMTRIEPLKEKRDLLTVTLKFSKQLVTDPRDPIYAIYSLVNDSKGIVMTPDYTLDTRAVYTSFARQLIEKDGRLDILHYVEMDDAEESTDVPSWVPDWRNKPHARSFGTENIARKIFSASQEKPTSFSFEPGETLVIRGRKLGSLSSEGVLFPTDCHRDMHSSKDENLHSRELRLHIQLHEFFQK